MTEQRRGYVAYLLRLWQVHSDGKTARRASLESAVTGQFPHTIHLVNPLLQVR